MEEQKAGGGAEEGEGGASDTDLEAADLRAELKATRSELRRAKKALHEVLWEFVPEKCFGHATIPRVNHRRLVETPRRIGEYRVGSVIGSGPFACVYTGWCNPERVATRRIAGYSAPPLLPAGVAQTLRNAGDPDSDAPTSPALRGVAVPEEPQKVELAKVAIKVAEAADVRNVRQIVRIHREIKAVKSCNHPYIIRLLDVIRTPARLYMITDYVGGGNLFQWLLSLTNGPCADDGDGGGGGGSLHVNSGSGGAPAAAAGPVAEGVQRAMGGAHGAPHPGDARRLFAQLLSAVASLLVRRLEGVA